MPGRQCAVKVERRRRRVDGSGMGVRQIVLVQDEQLRRLTEIWLEAVVADPSFAVTVKLSP